LEHKWRQGPSRGGMLDIRQPMAIYYTFDLYLPFHFPERRAVIIYRNI
jgi:hypothetical protein